MTKHDSSTEIPRIGPAQPRPWKKVKFFGVMTAIAFVIVVVLAFIDGITGIPLQYVAIYFGYLFFLTAILTIIFTILAGIQTYLASDRHKNAVWKSERDERRFERR